MKKIKHQSTTFEEALEKIEQIIERIKPGEVVSLPDIVRRAKTKTHEKGLASAAAMLLEKYGIEYRRE
jgi:hypothetical protein